MKRFLGLLLLAAVVYGGYIFYTQKITHPVSVAPLSSSLGSNLTLTTTSDKLGNLASVLGESAVSTYENGKELLSNATGGASEPIINELVSKTAETLKDLPRKEAEKIKYEFCRGVVTEYETKPANN